MGNYEKWDTEFRNQNLFAFNDAPNGLLWLKVRAVCRGRLLRQFLEKTTISLSSTKISEQNRELFHLLEDNPQAMLVLDGFLRDKNHNWYDSQGINEERLKEDLYKIQNYSWGGDHNNSLDKYLVGRYVKTIGSYDELLCKRDEIAANSWNYVQTSWYNNWTSYLIEAIFKRHAKVISAIGEIKSVDFFIGNKPFDLKVTYFPNQYMDEKLKEKLGKREISWLKAKAKENNIGFDQQLSESQLTYVLSEKFRERGLNSILEEQAQLRKQVVMQAKENPEELMQWLYENQGEMRFGAENRIYLILVDTQDMNQSWKLKRAYSIISPSVTKYLDNFTDEVLKLINFSFQHKSYQCFSDVIFVLK